MTDSLRNNLLSVRNERVRKCTDLFNTFKANYEEIQLIDKMLFPEKEKERKNIKGLMSELNSALDAIQSGSIADVTKSLIDMHPNQNKQGTMAKVATYLKRMADNGIINVNNDGKRKIYSVKTP